MSAELLRRATLLALWLPSASLLAEARGFSGRVVDRSGDPVPRAALELRCGAREPRSILADEIGRFELPSSATAGCRLTVRPPGGGEPPATVTLSGSEGALEIRLALDLFAARIEVRESAVRDALGSREIRESLARDAGDALEALAGVEKVRKGGIAHDVVLRGLKGESVAVEIDGQPLHGACPNRMDPPAFHVDFAEIERIEVDKGPFDVGSGALAGTVAIRTRRPAPGTAWEIGSSAGSAGYVAPSATVSHGAERWHLAAGFAARRGDPYEDGSGRAFTELLPPTAPASYRPDARDARAFDVRTGWLGAGWTPRPGQRLELAVTRQQADEQLYPYLAMDAAFDDATRLRASWTVQGVSPRIEAFETSVGGSRVDHRMDDRNRVSSAAAPRDWAMATDADARDLALRTEVTLRSGWSIGADLLRREWDATTWLAGAGYRPQASLPGTRVDTLALHAERSRRLGDALTLELGARLERASSSADPERADLALYRAYHATAVTSRDDLLPAASFGLSWTPSSAWALSARVGSAARVPDAQERWFALRRMGSDWVGDPELEPMRSNAVDLGASYRGARLSFDLNAWAARLDDAITLVEGRRVAVVPGVMNARARTYVNHDALMRGAEATLRAPLGDQLLLSASLAATRGERDLDAARGVVDRDLPELPPLTARLALRWQPGRWWLEGEGVGADRQDRVDAGLGETPTPGWTVLHVRGGFETERLALVVGVENVFDRAYREHLSYQRDPFRAGVAVPEPGRSATLSIRFRG